MRTGVTESEVAFDTWAWWEFLFGTPRGARLRRKFLARPQSRVHCSALSLGELAAKIYAAGWTSRVDRVLARVRARAIVHDVTPQLAAEGARLKVQLRAAHRNVGLIDGIILATARQAGARLISGDPAFGGQPDVRAS